LRQLAPQFALGYEPLFRFIDIQTGQAKQAGQPVLQHKSVRLRLAQLLMTSPLYPDAVLGLAEAYKTLSDLEQLELPEEQRAQIELSKRQIAETLKGLPATSGAVVVTPSGLRTYSEVQTHFLSERVLPPWLYVSRAGNGGYVPE
jgi:hypothetical protein